jgi:thiol-disulfide isomerase/thioredoxin
MKLRALIIALLSSLLFGGIIIGLFNYWKQKTQPNESIGTLSKLASMEKNGIPVANLKTILGVDIHIGGASDKGNSPEVTIINFWASWCSPCVEEVPSLIELATSLKGQVRVIAISEDSNREDLDSFLRVFPKLKNPNISIILDENKSMMNLYGVQRLPESFIVGPDGRLVKKVIGSINWHTPDSEAFIQGILSRPK